MGTTNRTNLNPTELHEEFGPAPWWSREHLAELIEDRGLTAADIARVWDANPENIRRWVHRHGLQEGAA